MTSSWRMRERLPRRDKPQSESELRVRASSLEGVRIRELAAALHWPLPHNEKAAKGYIGQLIEAALGSDEDAHERPDFVDLGIECKTVPCTQDTHGQWHPKESTFVCSINVIDASHAQWDSSRVRLRLGAVLYVAVQAAHLAPLPDRLIVSASIWRPSAFQWQRLRADWEDLMGAIGSGRGHSLGADEGEILQVRPKAATSQVRTLGMQEDGPGSVLPLGFYLRAKFVDEILNSPVNPSNGAH